MNFNNRKASHGNGKLFGSMLYHMNNRGPTNVNNKIMKEQGKVFKATLSNPNPFYNYSQNLNFNGGYNPGTAGLRMVTPPNPDDPRYKNNAHIADNIKPSNFGKGTSEQENNAIHKASTISAINNAQTGRSHFD